MKLARDCSENGYVRTYVRRIVLRNYRDTYACTAVKKLGGDCGGTVGTLYGNCKETIRKPYVRR